MSPSWKWGAPLAIAAAVAVAFAGCQLVVDLDGLEDQHCPANQKACPGGGCVRYDDPETGCNDVGTCSPCAPPHAKASCDTQLHCSFVPTACIRGWDNCDGITQNGCETDLAHTVKHCGMCFNLCPAKPFA